MPRRGPDGKERRRSRGEGSVYKLPNGRHAAAIDVAPLPGETAKRPRLVRQGRTAAEARATLAQALAERAQAAHAATHLTFAAFAAEWLRDVIAPTRRPRTVETYTHVLTRYVLPALGSRELVALTPRDLQGVYATLQRAGLHSTAHQVHGVIHTVLAYAERVELIPRNPANRVERPRPPTPTRRRLTRVEAQRVLAALADRDDGALYEVALFTGARVSELVGLRWTAVDWEASAISIHAQWQRGGGRDLQGPPKSRARVVTVPARVLAALRRHQERQAFARQAAGPVWQGHDLIFPDPTGAPQTGRHLRERWQRFARALGIAGMTFHSLRHSHASLARAAGVGIEVTQETLGHSSPSITLGVYTHVEEAQRADAARRLAAYLDDAESG